MTRLAVLLIATTAITTTHVAADAYSTDQEQPFFWTDISTESVVAPGMPTQQNSAPQQPTPAVSQRPAEPLQPIAIPSTPSAQPKRPSQNPIMEDYPTAQAPRAAAPQAGIPRYLDVECHPAQTAPDMNIFSDTPRPGATGRRSSGHDARRGEMAGDDGVIEGIMDDPCAYIHRRGGETPDSARGYTHPDDIRRVNTLEDRRIPIHNVGRYAPDGTGSWSQDRNNPYVDSSSTWMITRGRMVSEVLIEWGDTAGWDVIWRSPHDFVVQADVTIRGTFPEAAGQVIDSFADANPPIAGDLYPTNRVLVVDSAAAFDGR